MTAVRFEATDLRLRYRDVEPTVRTAIKVLYSRPPEEIAAKLVVSKIDAALGRFDR